MFQRLVTVCCSAAVITFIGGARDHLCHSAAMMRADLCPAGSFIQNTPTNRRRQSIAATPSRRASINVTPVTGAPTDVTPVAVRQAPSATVVDRTRRGGGGGEEAADRCRLRARRPGSAWKNRHRRPQFTDDFDAFDDAVVDLDAEELNVDEMVVENSPTGSPTDAGAEAKTSRAWRDDATAAGERRVQQSRPADVARANRRRGSRQQATTETAGGENWTSSGETSKRGSVELAPDFELSHIRAKVLEKCRGCVRESGLSPRQPRCRARGPSRRPSESQSLSDSAVDAEDLNVKVAIVRGAGEVQRDGDRPSTRYQQAEIGKFSFDDRRRFHGADDDGGDGGR